MPYPEPQRTLRKNRGIYFSFLLCILCISSVSSVIRAEIIDRILAVVSGQIITKSDVDAAQAFGIAGSLDELIDRTLMLGEVRRVAPPEPAPAAVTSSLAKIRSRFASPVAYTRALSSSGLDEAALTIYAADSLRLSTYLDERFSSASQPADDEIRQYALEHAGTTLDQARDEIAADRRHTLTAAWVSELRRRADITVLQ